MESCPNWPHFPEEFQERCNIYSEDKAGRNHTTFLLFDTFYIILCRLMDRCPVFKWEAYRRASESQTIIGY
jgi:hypothetical protein